MNEEQVQAPNVELQENPNTRRANNQGQGAALSKIKRIGPLELTLLERVEHGLNHIGTTPANQSPRHKNPTLVDKKTNKKVKKYTGEKQVIEMTGWVKVDEIYWKYFGGLVSKVIIASMMLAIHFCAKGHWEYLTGMMGLFASLLVFRNQGLLVANYNSDPKLKQIYTIESGIQICMVLVLLGASMYAYFPDSRMTWLFAQPYIAFGIYICFLNHTQNEFTGSKLFTVIEGIQFLVIALKMDNIITLEWSFIMIYFMLCCIYMIVLGCILTVVLLCTIVGYMYKDMESWKVKSLIWLSLYYGGYGFCMLNLMKIFMVEQPKNMPYIDLYNIPCPRHTTLFVVSCIVMLLNSQALCVLHLTFKQSIKKYFARVMFKDDLRRELAIKKINKDFPLRFIQLSSTFFKKDTDLTPEAQELEKSVICDNISSNGDLKPTAKANVDIPDNISTKTGENFCVICYTNPPNTLAEPCGHSSICDECIFELLQREKKCPLCRKEMATIYIIKREKGSKVVKLDKEIAFSEDQF